MQVSPLAMVLAEGPPYVQCRNLVLDLVSPSSVRTIGKLRGLATPYKLRLIRLDRCGRTRSWFRWLQIKKQLLRLKSSPCSLLSMCRRVVLLFALLVQSGLTRSPVTLMQPPNLVCPSVRTSLLTNRVRRLLSRWPRNTISV